MADASHSLTGEERRGRDQPAVYHSGDDGISPSVCAHFIYIIVLDYG